MWLHGQVYLFDIKYSGDDDAYVEWALCDCRLHQQQQTATQLAACHDGIDRMTTLLASRMAYDAVARDIHARTQLELDTKLREELTPQLPMPPTELHTRFDEISEQLTAGMFEHMQSVVTSTARDIKESVSCD